MNSRAGIDQKRGKILSAGSVMLDFLSGPVDILPRWGENIFVPDTHLAVGGLAANVALCLAKFHAPVTLLGRIGVDLSGDFIFRRLADAGVDCRYLRRDKKAPTSLSIGLIREHGQRLFIVSLGANATVQRADFNGIYWERICIFHLGGFFHLTQLERDLPGLMRSAQKRGITTSLDLAWDPSNRWAAALRPTLRYTDIFFPNEAQARRLTEKRHPARVVEVLRGWGIKTVVIKMGERGCFVADVSWEGSVPGFPVRAVDTTGAGDNFDAAFLYGLRAGWDVRRCACFANVVAALSTRAFGASAAVPDRTMALRSLREYYGAFLSKLYR